MVDLANVQGFGWDDGNRRKSLDKHKVTEAEAEQVFVHEPLIVEDVEHSVREDRYRALGETKDGRRLHVTFTFREEGRKIRVISARDMNRKERAIYEEA
jgi:uncharacterized DUF497 family protein